MIDMSSTMMWLIPVWPVNRPAYPGVIFTLRPVWAMSTRIWSSGRTTANETNVLMNGTRPMVAIPAATPSMFCSAIPIWR
jgi:hypothetical protein